MKDLVWDESLSVQIQEIDDDHKKLVELFNMLNHSVTEEDDTDYIEAIIEELISCTTWHFRHEERLMLKYAYDGLQEHKKEHQELIDSARELQQKFLQENKTLSSKDLKSLEHWLTGHILGSDMEMSSQLSELM